MSILKTTLQDACAVLKAVAAEKPDDVEWPAYVNACQKISARYTDPVEQALNKKRAHAFKYLGDKARSYGEDPRVFTPQFVSKLGEANSVWRAKRNPRLLAMLKYINGMDSSLVNSGNVLPFGSQDFSNLQNASGNTSMPA
jgi:hypothetical protein